MPSLPLFTAATTLQRPPLSHVRFPAAAASPGAADGQFPTIYQQSLKNCEQTGRPTGNSGSAGFPLKMRGTREGAGTSPGPPSLLSSPTPLPPQQASAGSKFPPPPFPHPRPPRSRRGKAARSGEAEGGGRRAGGRPGRVRYTHGGGGTGHGGWQRQPCPAPSPPRTLLTMRLQSQRGGRDQAGLQFTARIPTAATTDAKTKLGV